MAVGLKKSRGVTSLLNTHTGAPALSTPPAEAVGPVPCPAPSEHMQVAAPPAPT